MGDPRDSRGERARARRRRRRPAGPRHPRHPRTPLPRHPRRGPHGDPLPFPPPRTRTVVARARRIGPRIERRFPRPGRPVALRHWAHDRHLRAVGRHDPPLRRRTGTSASTRGTPAMVQPASVDLRLGNSFRVFHNHRITAVDLGDPPSELTEQVARRGRRHVRHPSRRVLPRAHPGVGRAARRRRRAHRGQELARAPRARRARDGGLLRPRLEGHAHARARELQLGPDHPAPGPADRPAVVHDARPPGRAPLRPPGPRQPLPRPGRGDREPVRRRPRGSGAVRAANGRSVG